MAFFAGSAIASPVEQAISVKGHGEVRGRWDIEFPPSDSNCVVRNKCCYFDHAACIRQRGRLNNYIEHSCDHTDKYHAYCSKNVQSICGTADCCRTDVGHGRNCPPHFVTERSEVLSIEQAIAKPEPESEPAELIDAKPVM
ncbi:uncharacterized protein RSE6_00016 [Rhynchosporium secalis]|uniref:Uncharacterized protein n=1 Tax=Rhynchosporium secalis TaxID=38038 RepID=A0A1E1LU66_RHYSE|nr:uncharacterized protein RSE6_00016 [Rhynchosporium secalis]